ncbi:MAG: hypothetical protein FJ263_00285 [Planctomycetes bacterium]|nr:hypothetical protein [Planctomycetota bacterium]
MGKSELIKSVLASAAMSASDFVRDVASYGMFSGDDIRRKKSQIDEQAKEYETLNRRIREKRHRLTDCIFLGGDVLTDMISQSYDIPGDVLEAYQTVYPDLAAAKSFQDAVNSYDENQLTGFISSIKGKLFEMQYADHLNSGVLPEGYYAELAHSVTQPGWDIEVVGPDGHIADLIQTKATDSAQYVLEALHRYPDIDVVTTGEVYSQLVMQDMTERITDSGISNDVITDYVNDTIDGTSIHMDWSPPLISLALIAFTAYSMENLSLYEKSAHFGTRAGKSYLCYLLGKGAAVFTQSWPLGLAVSLVSRYLAVKGKAQRDVYLRLCEIEQTNDKIIGRLESHLSKI